MNKVVKREDVPVHMTWNLSDLFPSQADWEAALKVCEERAEQIKRFSGRLQESARTLLDCLNEENELVIDFMKAASYSRLCQAQDGKNPQYLANAAKTSDVGASMDSSLSFIESEILDIPEAVLTKFLQEEPGLQVYERSLTRLMESKPHRLSPETERVLASLGTVLSAPYRIYLRGKLSDMTFQPVQNQSGQELPLSFNLFETSYELSPDTTLRRAAYEEFCNSLQGSKHTIAEAYATEVKKQVVLSRLRGYDSVTDMLLQPQQVTTKMYHQIHDVLLTELAPHMRRLMRLKKKVLGLDRMLYCDLKAPLDPDYQPQVSYEEASKTIMQALSIYGEEYQGIMSEALTNRWVDYANNDGKSTGAFCSSTYGAHSYILISWADNMRSAFTLAHELGHAGHLMLAARYQHRSNSRPSLYFIEAPSTMNELILADHLLAISNDKQMRRWVILQLLNTYYHNYVTHLLEAELQRRVYKLAMADEAISANVMSELMGSVLTDFWGDEVEITEGAKLTWMRQPHYYMGLYPYTYAAGLTASTAVAQKIREEGKPAIERWEEVLKTGGSKSPLELMRMAGLDMSEPGPISSAVEYVGSLVAELEALYE